MKLFEIQELRNKIFSYLRTQPYVRCAVCGEVCQWDELGPRRMPSIVCYGSPQCSRCFQRECQDNTDEYYLPIALFS